MLQSPLASVIERAALPYRSSGRYAWHFARGKLRHDPLFRYLFEQRGPLKRGNVLDLGCGYGLLFAWLAAAGTRTDLSERAWHGMELQPLRVRIARQALGGMAHIDCCDIRYAELPTASIIVIADVLFYMSTADQDRVLAKAVHALEPGGTLLLREADSQAGLRFYMTRWAERLVGAARGTFWQKLQYRGVGEWCAALARLGLTVTLQPMHDGTPFSNVLFVCRK